MKIKEDATKLKHYMKHELQQYVVLGTLDRVEHPTSIFQYVNVPYWQSITKVDV